MKTLAITGVNRGIGEGVALRFITDGWHVHGFGRTAPSWLNEFGSLFSFTQCDFASPESIIVACAEIRGPVDILLCSAASFGPNAFHLSQFESANFLETLAVNLVSPAVMAREMRTRLLEGTNKLIVMMSTGNASLAGNISGSMLAYRTSKSALNQLVRNIAAEWGEDGLTALALNPGWVRTSMGGDAAPLSVEEASEQIYAFLCDRASPELNGAFVNTDGSALPW